MGVFKMSWRNLWRNRRRTIVTLAAMTLALTLMIVYSALVDGYVGGMRRNILDLEAGDIQIFAKNYRDKPSIYERIHDPASLLKALDKKGYRAAPRLMAPGLVASGDTSTGVFFRGVDIQRDSQVSAIHKHVRSGHWLDMSKSKSVVLGRRLAKTLGVKPGSELVIVAQDADGSMANDLFTVGGILKGISDGIDRTGVFLTEAAFRELFVFPEGSHQIIVRRPPSLPLAKATEEVAAINPQLETLSWRQLMPTLATMLDSTGGQIAVMFAIVYIVIGILILNAMLMAVFERIREFGVLKALGMGPTVVFRLVMMETAIKTLIAVAMGTALSVPVLWYLTVEGIDLGRMGGGSVAGIAWDTVWRASVSSNNFRMPIIMLVAIVFIAALYPALKAALIRPVAAIQYR